MKIICTSKVVNLKSRENIYSPKRQKVQFKQDLSHVEAVDTTSDFFRQPHQCPQFKGIPS